MKKVFLTLLLMLGGCVYALIHADEPYMGFDFTASSSETGSSPDWYLGISTRIPNPDAHTQMEHVMEDNIQTKVYAVHSDGSADDIGSVTCDPLGLHCR